MWFFYLKFFLVEIWLTLATWSKSRINHYHHPLLNGPGMLTEYFWVGSFPLHFCRILDTTTEHFRPYLEGGVVVFLIPTNLHTVTDTYKKTHFLKEKAKGVRPSKSDRLYSAHIEDKAPIPFPLKNRLFRVNVKNSFFLEAELE